MDYYFDTSAIVKIYHKETGSELAVNIFENIHRDNYLSQFNEIAFVSADKKLCEVVTAMGYVSINPEDPENRYMLEPV